MRVIDEQAWSWMLLEDQGVFYLSVACGSIGVFERHVRLNESEGSRYRSDGVAYILSFANEIRMHEAKFSARHLTNFDSLPGVKEAIEAWRAEHSLKAQQSVQPDRRKDAAPG